ncbi:protein of unknown function [Azospirillum lipoferum 4B]|uniref:Uncharacterized protein n=1 Tax=Azospirillum lipoferum (strain 4B) TaxID=862719 RepID=G7Z702_AZOL4|nr:protein of unknown function [Azospirillum lipoferum 4B]
MRNAKAPERAPLSYLPSAVPAGFQHFGKMPANLRADRPTITVNKRTKQFGVTRIDHSDFGRAHDRWDRQPGRIDVTDRYIRRPPPVLGAGNHQHPDQAVACFEHVSCNDQCRSALPDRAIGVRERNLDDVPGFKDRHRPAGRLRCPIP